MKYVAPIFRTTPSSIRIRNQFRGREMSDYTWVLRQRVISYLRENHGNDVTSKDVWRTIKQNKKNVVLQLKWLEKHGVIVQVNKGEFGEDATWRNVDREDIKMVG